MLLDGQTEVGQPREPEPPEPPSNDDLAGKIAALETRMAALEASITAQRTAFEASITALGATVATQQTTLEASIEALQETLEQRITALEAEGVDAPPSRLLIVPFNQTDSAQESSE